MKTIGFIVNPVAGMGGSVGLKGTDGLVEEALRRGAKPMAQERAKNALEGLAGYGVKFLACSGVMGGDILREVGVAPEIVYSLGEETTAEDTREACRIFLKEKTDLILFCGGDGTARDVYSIVKDKIPILGVPSGVKMHSAVFSINPRTAAEVITGFLNGELQLKDAEVMDVDEEAYRDDRIDVKLFGYAKVPYKPELVQGRKFIFNEESDEQSKENIARFALEFMRDDPLYIIGAGSTTKKILDLMGLEGTLLGVDLVKDGRLIARDVNEKQILSFLGKREKAKIIVGVIGAQGFIFGRGSQQISPKVIKKVGIENIIIVATPHKLANTPHLLVDTGDGDIDKKMSGFRQVVCGYRMAQRKKVLST
ncbi:MAG: ATP-NAD kinase family protein [Candidatus Altiarchaeota archaeon]|nr:ATP-NAD kinase family protein [Candidatus Altiarchaeota archaeon]